MSDARYWLGTNPIHEEESRVTLPKQLVELGLASVDAAVFWGYDAEEDAVVLSRRREEFADGDRFTFVEEEQVGVDRVTSIPLPLMEGYQGVEVVDESRAFEYGERLHFATTADLAAADACMALSRDAAADRFPELVDEESDPDA